MNSYPDHRRLAVFSQFFPPALNGNAISLGNFLSRLNPEKIIGFTRRQHIYHKNDPSMELGCKIVDIEPPIPVVAEKVFIRLKKAPLAKLPFLPYSIQKAVWHSKHFGAEAVLASFGQYYFTVAYAVSQILNLDLYLLVFDPIYLSAPGESLVYPYAMKKVMSSAQHVMAFNRCLADEIKRIYGRECQIVPQIADVDAIYELDDKTPADPLRLVFTGMVSAAHIDSLRFLMETLEKYDYPAQMYIYTSLKLDFFHKHNIPTSKLKISLVPKTEVKTVQHNADVLVVFSSFSYPKQWRDVIITMYPTKVVEYYSASRPILLIGSDDACISRYAKEFGSMAVVNKRDEQLLLATLDKIRNSSNFRKSLIKNAHNALYELHHPNIVLPKFLNIINGNL